MKTMLWIPIVILAVAASVGSATSAQAKAGTNKAGTNKAGTNKAGTNLTLDGGPILQRTQVKEGLNVLTSTDEGYKFAVELKNGSEPVWLGIAPDGTKIPATLRQEKRAGGTTCWDCIRTDKSTVCMKIPCPKPWRGSNRLID